MFKNFSLYKFQNLAKDDVGRVKTVQRAMTIDASFGFCSVCLVQFKCSFARLWFLPSALHRQICTDKTGCILLTPTEKQDYKDI